VLSIQKLLTNDLFICDHPENKGWWLSELNSLGINLERIEIFNDIQLLSNITENIKRAFFQEYKQNKSYNC
jgi:hypothetical protein